MSKQVSLIFSFYRVECIKNRTGQNTGLVEVISIQNDKQPSTVFWVGQLPSFCVNSVLRKSIQEIIIKIVMSWIILIPFILALVHTKVIRLISGVTVAIIL